jgi:hypothetical protein
MKLKNFKSPAIRLKYKSIEKVKVIMEGAEIYKITLANPITGQSSLRGDKLTSNELYYCSVNLPDALSIDKKRKIVFGKGIIDVSREFPETRIGPARPARLWMTKESFSASVQRIKSERK